MCSNRKVFNIFHGGGEKQQQRTCKPGFFLPDGGKQLLIMSENINTGSYIPGYYIPNIRKLADVVINVLGISVPVSIMPLRIKTPDEIGCAEKRGGEYIIYIDQNTLRNDELSDFVISLFIHEIWHVKQMANERLLLNAAHTIAIWEGMHYRIDTIVHDNRPWEIEAKRMEAVYLEKVKEQMEGNN